MTRGARSVTARSRRAPAVGKKANGGAIAGRATTNVVGSNCSGSCLTKDHKTYGECLRAKNLQLSPAVNEAYGQKQKQWDKDLNHYESAVRQGLQPKGTQRHQVDAAIKEAERG